MSDENRPTLRPKRCTEGGTMLQVVPGQRRSGTYLWIGSDLRCLATLDKREARKLRDMLTAWVDQ